MRDRLAPILVAAVAVVVAYAAWRHYGAPEADPLPAPPVAGEPVVDAGHGDVESRLERPRRGLPRRVRRETTTSPVAGNDAAEPEAAPRRLAGVVRDDHQSLVAGAPVSLAEDISTGNPPIEGDVLGGVRTNDVGEFVFEGLPSRGRFLLSVSDSRYAPARLSIDAAAIPELVEVILRQGLEINGIVRNPTGGGIEGASVRVYDLSFTSRDPERQLEGTATTDAGGRYAVRHLTSGQKRIAVFCAGYAALGRAPVIVPPTRGLAGVDFTLAEGAPIAGRVRSAAGDPVPGAIVEARSETGSGDGDSVALRSARSGADGVFEIPGVRPGSFMMLARAEGFAPGRLAGVPAGSRDVEFALEPIPPVTGRVLDAATGEPVTAFTVFIGRTADPGMVPPSARRRVTDAEGRFLIPDVGHGLYWVFAEADGYAVGRTENAVRVAEGTGADGIVIRLTRGGVIVGRVVGRNGLPVPGALVTPLLTPPDTGAGANRMILDLVSAVAGWDTFTTDGRGVFRADALPDGRFEIILRQKDHAWTRTAPIVVSGESEADIGTIVLARGAVIRGTVRTSDGSPDPHARALVVGQFRPPVQIEARTDAEGRFEARSLPAGEYRVTLVERGGRFEIQNTLGSGPGSRTLVLAEGEERDVDF